MYVCQRRRHYRHIHKHDAHMAVPLPAVPPWTKARTQSHRICLCAFAGGGAAGKINQITQKHKIIEKFQNSRNKIQKTSKLSQESQTYQNGMWRVSDKGETGGGQMADTGGQMADRGGQMADNGGQMADIWRTDGGHWR